MPNILKIFWGHSPQTPAQWYFSIPAYWSQHDITLVPAGVRTADWKQQYITMVPIGQHTGTSKTAHWCLQDSTLVPAGQQHDARCTTNWYQQHDDSSKAHWCPVRAGQQTVASSTPYRIQQNSGLVPAGQQTIASRATYWYQQNK